LFNTMGEYYKVGKELEDAEESFEVGAAGAGPP
jgi:hypothetical protein